MHSILGRNMRNKMEEFSSLMHTRLRAPPTPASALHAAMWSLRTFGESRHAGNAFSPGDGSQTRTSAFSEVCERA